MSDSLTPLSGVRLLLTGGTGFVGSGFARHAVRLGAEVRVVERPAADPWRLETIQGRYTTIPRELRDLDSVTRAAAGSPDVVVHFAAAGVNQLFDDVTAMVETNVSGTLRVLQCAQRVGAGRFVLIGTSGEYGPGDGLQEDAPLRPTSEYAASRAAATLVARAFGDRRAFDVVVVRPFAVYGPYEAAYRLLPYCILNGLRGQPLKISSGVQSRDYVHVDDVAEAIGRASVSAEARGGTFNVCTGVPTEVRDAAALVASLTKGGSVVEAGARKDIPGEMWQTSGDPGRARSQLGWLPRYSLEEGLTQTIAWFRSVGAHLPVYQSQP